MQMCFVVCNESPEGEEKGDFFSEEGEAFKWKCVFLSFFKSSVIYHSSKCSIFMWCATMYLPLLSSSFNSFVHIMITSLIALVIAHGVLM